MKPSASPAPTYENGRALGSPLSASSAKRYFRRSVLPRLWGLHWEEKPREPGPGFPKSSGQVGNPGPTIPLFSAVRQTPLSREFHDSPQHVIPSSAAKDLLLPYDVDQREGQKQILHFACE